MSNATKTNMTTTEKLDKVYNHFIKCVNGKPFAKVNYSNATQKYCGFTDFSVNFKTDKYVVYMSNDNANICKSINDKLVINDDKKPIKSRSKFIEFTNIDTLLKCITKVTENKLANAK